MGKTKKKKKKDKKFSFQTFLKKNQEDVTLIENGEKISLEKAVEESVNKMTAVPFDAVLAVSPEEATEGKKVDFGLAAHYSGAVFKLFELGLVSEHPYTIIFTIDGDDAESFFSEYNPALERILNKSDLNLILTGAKKKLAKLKNWLWETPEDDFDMFVITIPDIALFKNGVKDGKADIFRCNLCVQVLKGKRSISKIKKRGGELLETLCKFIIKCTMENIKDHGFSNLVIPLSDEFAEDMYAVTENWQIQLDLDESLPKLVNKINFTVTDTTDYAIVSKSCQDYEEKKHKA